MLGPRTPPAEDNGRAVVLDRADLELTILHRVGGLDHLHFGLWEPGDELTHANLQRAQRRFMEHLIAWVPAGTRTVLDAGCGIGAGTKMIRDAGYQVEGLNPSRYQGSIFRNNGLAGIPLHACKFEDFQPSRRFDCVVSSESSQYMDMKRLWEAAARTVAPEGCILFADWYLKPGGRDVWGVHEESRFIEAGARAGFALEADEDITERAVPTQAYLSAFHRDHVVPTMELLEIMAPLWAPFWWRLVRVLLRGRLKNLRYLLAERMPERFSPDTFRNNARYRILRFSSSQGHV